MMKTASAETRREYPRSAEDVAETVRQAGEIAGDTARQSAEATTDAGGTLVGIFAEQTRHNMQVAAALAQAVDWGEVAAIQRDFVLGSFARASRLGEAYRQIFQAGTTPGR